MEICMPNFLQESFDFTFNEEVELETPEINAFRGVCKELLEIKSKLNEINKDFDVKVLEERYKNQKRLVKQIETHRLKIEKLKTHANKLKTKIEPLRIEVECLKDTQLKKSEAMKYLLHKYKSLLNIHLAITSYSDEECLIYISYFTTTRPDKPKYYMKLLFNQIFKTWTLMEIEPQPNNFNKIVEQLTILQDIQGCFEAVRRIFLKYKK